MCVCVCSMFVHYIMVCGRFYQVNDSPFSLLPIGTVMLNPNFQDSPSIMIQYFDYGAAKPIAYPDHSDVLQLAANEMKGVSKFTCNMKDGVATINFGHH